MNRLDVYLQNSFLYAPFRKRILKNVVLTYFRQYSDKLCDKRILEIGCGNGQGASLIKNIFAPAKIIATDLDERLIRVAKRNIKDQSIHFEIADATNLPYKDTSFDAVFDFGVIHHIPDWKNCLNELRRVLKSKGLIFIYDIPIESFNGLWGYIIKMMTSHPYDSMFHKKEFVAYLNKLKFKILTEKVYQRYFVVVAKKI